MVEQNLDKYRLHRRLLGPAYTPAAMSQMESNMDEIILAQIDIMKQRAGIIVDFELFFSKFISGICHLH